LEDSNVKSNMVIQEMKIRADRAYQHKLKAEQESNMRALVLDTLAKDLLTKTKNNEVSDDEESVEQITYPNPKEGKEVEPSPHPAHVVEEVPQDIPVEQEEPQDSGCNFDVALTDDDAGPEDDDDLDRIVWFKYGDMEKSKKFKVQWLSGKSTWESPINVVTHWPSNALTHIWNHHQSDIRVLDWINRSKQIKRNIKGFVDIEKYAWHLQLEGAVAPPSDAASTLGSGVVKGQPTKAVCANPIYPMPDPIPVLFLPSHP
jgi:hypothetical protein